MMDRCSKGQFGLCTGLAVREAVFCNRMRETIAGRASTAGDQ